MGFLKTTNLPWLPRLAFAPIHRAPAGDTLVVIFLRGAADVLNMVVPHTETAYYSQRPTLGIPRPDDLRVPADQRTLDLDGFFGFHPAMRPLLESWQNGHLAIVHACGAPDESRSHFKAMELMERGVENERGPASGWIGRHLAALDTGNRSPLRAVGLGSMPQRSLSGSVPVSALRSIADFHFSGDPRAVAQIQTILKTVYAQDNTGQDALHIFDILTKLDPASSQGAYPASEFGVALKQTAMLIKAQVGLEVAAIDLGNWDTHFAQGGALGLQANLIEDLSTGMAVFYADLAAFLPQLTVVTMSEFGRRVGENGSLGTDHGHGSMMMVMSGQVSGGKVYGTWPGLQPAQLVGPGDLAVTTDYRDVLAEICQVRLKNPALGDIFPGFKPEFLNIFK